MKRILLISIAMLSIVLINITLPLYALAQGGGGTIQPAPPQPLSNPLADADPRVIIGRIIGAVLGIIGSIALAVFIFGGFTWMTSAGSPERVRKGKDMVVWAVLGLE